MKSSEPIAICAAIGYEYYQKVFVQSDVLDIDRKGFSNPHSCQTLKS